MYAGLYYLSATVIDVCKRKIKRMSVLVSLIIIVGLISMAQPWNKTAENTDICQIPCDYWDETRMHNVTINNESRPEIYTHRFLNQQFQSQSNNSCKMKQDSNFIYIDGVKHKISIHPFVLGYILVLIAVLSGTTRAYITKDLRMCVESQILIFWLVCFEGILAVLMSIIWSNVNGVPIYSIPSGNICLILFVSYGFFAGVLYVVWMYSAGYLNISKLALARVVVLLMLYVCQRTF